MKIFGILKLWKDLVRFFEDLVGFLQKYTKSPKPHTSAHLLLVEKSSMGALERYGPRLL